MEKTLGLDKLADDLRKTSKGFMNDLDLMYSSDESDWNVFFVFDQYHCNILNITYSSISLVMGGLTIAYYCSLPWAG